MTQHAHRVLGQHLQRVLQVQHCFLCLCTHTAKVTTLQQLLTTQMTQHAYRVLGEHLQRVLQVQNCLLCFSTHHGRVDAASAVQRGKLLVHIQLGLRFQIKECQIRSDQIRSTVSRSDQIRAEQIKRIQIRPRVQIGMQTTIKVCRRKGSRLRSREVPSRGANNRCRQPSQWGLQLHAGWGGGGVKWHAAAAARVSRRAHCAIAACILLS
jgi:hypothetical protein